MFFLLFLAYSVTREDEEFHVEIEMPSGPCFFNYLEELQSLFFIQRPNKTASFYGSNLSLSYPTVSYDGKYLKLSSISENAFSNSFLEEVAIKIPLDHIGSGAFSNSTRLRSVNLEATAIEKIPENCFSFCSSLKSIKLPTSCKEIHAKAFFGAGVESINLPEVLSFIGTSCFEQSALKEIDLSKTKLTNLSIKTFANCSNLKSFVLPVNTTTVVESLFQYSAFKTLKIQKNIEILEKNCFSFCRKLNTIDLSNTMIHEIKECSFLGCVSLETVKFPKTLKKIGDFAFSRTGFVFFSFPKNISFYGIGILRHCSYLETVDFTNSDLTEAPEEVCVECRKLKEIKFSKKINKIGRRAFASTSIATINFPSVLMNIKEGAFENCCNLTTVDFTKTNIMNISSFAFANCNKLSETIFRVPMPSFGEFVFLNTAFKKIIFDSETVAAGKGMYANCTNIVSVDLSNIILDVLPQSIFENCSSLKKIVWPDFQLAIGARAFYGCAIESLEIQSIISSMGPASFMGCSRLKRVLMNNVILDEIPSFAFANCGSLEIIEFPTGIVRFCNNVFAGSAIKSIFIPPSIVKLGNATFKGCRALTVANLESSVIETISNEMFRDCVNLETIVWPKNKFNIGEFSFANTGFVKIFLPELAISLHRGAFSGCRRLDFANLSCTSFDVPDETFRDCINLSLIHYPKNNIEIGDFALSGTNFIIYQVNENIKSLGKGMFMGCKNIRILDCSRCIVEVIPEMMMKDCVNLEEVIINDDSAIREFSDYSFSGCFQLVNFTFQRVVHKIGVAAFANTSLENVVLLSNLVELEAEAFANCRNLVSVDIDLAPFAMICERCFINCTSLTEFIFSRYSIAILPRAFENCGFTKLDIPKQVSYITPYAFCNCKNLVSVDLSQYELTKLHSGVFANCSRLSKVILPVHNKELCAEIFMGTAFQSITLDSTFALGKGAFRNCFNLEIVNLSETTIETISDFAFQNCTKLSSIVLPESVLELGAYAFANTNISSLVAPKTMLTIGSHCFENSVISFVDAKGLKEIGDSAFECCPISSFSFPTKRELRIGKRAFAKTCLTTVFFPPELNELGDEAFADSKLEFADMQRTALTKVNLSAFRNTRVETIILPNFMQEIYGAAPHAKLYFCGNTPVRGIVKEAVSLTIKPGQKAIKGVKIIESNECALKIVRNNAKEENPTLAK